MNWNGFPFFFSGSILFVVILNAGEFIFSLGYARADRFYLRFPVSIAVQLALSVPLTMAYYVCAESVDSDVVTNISAIICYMFMFVLSVASMAVCMRENMRAYLICGIAGYAVQHLFYNAYTIFSQLAPIYEILYSGSHGMAFSLTMDMLVQLVFAATVVVLVYLIFVRRAERQSPEDVVRRDVLPISAVTLVIVLLLNAVRNIFTSESLALSILCEILLAVCCIFILLMRAGVLERISLKRDLYIRTYLHREELKRYEQMKRNIELVNIKCHDIKHWLSSGGHLSRAAGDELERLVNIYDCNANTGNAALDTILSDRSLYCSANGIRMTVLADGGKLGFMSEDDVYSLFGNIIENAIEAAGNIDDADKRVISVKIREIAGQISIIEENYTAVMPEFVNGLPRTTKKDTDYHGFGMRSIQLIAKKYGGMLTCSADDGVFRLALLIPLPAAKPEK